MSPPTQKKSQPIDSMAKLQRRLPVILKALNDDPQLFLAATANPVLAIEEIGYSFTDDFKQELEWRLRFPENTRRKMTRLRKQMSTAAGRDLPLAEPEALQRVLFEELGIARPGDDACQTALADAALDASTDALTSAPRPAVFGRTLSDPLAVLAGDAHPVIKPLLEFRTLEASEPRFATTELYEKVRRGEAELPVRNLRLRMGQERRGGAED